MLPEGTERLRSRDHRLWPHLRHDTLVDFWRWAFGDLKANDVRGVFAEWLVERILDLPLAARPRDSWASCDLQTPDGFRIEVKAAAYLQTWEQKTPSRITFTGLRGRTWTPQNGYSDEATYNADLYVFCLHTEKDPDNWDALDLDQWRFYVLLRREVEAIGQGSLGLGPLEKMTQALTAVGLRAKVAEVTAAWRKDGPAPPPSHGTSIPSPPDGMV